MSGRTPQGDRPGGPEAHPLAEAPPATDEDAERAVLGGLLLREDSQTVLRLVDQGLRADSFYWASHAAVFSAMIALARRREEIDPITVSAEMERLDIAEGFSRSQVDDLASYCPSSRNLTAYANIVKDMAEWRERRKATFAMFEAIRERDVKAWKKIVAVFAPPAPSDQSTKGNGSRTLRIVDAEGEVVREEQHCDGCRELQDQLDGAGREIAGWRSRYAKLARDKDAEARNHGWWQTAQRLFEYWKKKTNHKRSSFTADRFYECVPYLLNPTYGPDKVERAIAGIAFDPFVTTRLNGTKKRHDDWDLIFRSTGKFEEYVNKAPLPWESELHLSGPQSSSGPEQTGSAQLIVVEGKGGA